MVYFRKKAETKQSANYQFGLTPDTQDGEIQINSDCTYKILKQPSSKVGELWIQKMIVRHRNEFKNGIFADKLAYEA